MTEAPKPAAAPPTAPGALGKPPREVRPDAHLRPPRWLTRWTLIETVLAVVWLAFALLEFTRPATTSGGAILFFLLGLPLALTWCVRAILLLIWGIRDKPAPARCVAPGLVAAVVPFLGFLGASSLATDEDFMIRFGMLDDKLAAEADAVRAAGQGTSTPFRVGMLRVESSRLADDGSVSFLLRDEYDFLTRVESRVIQIPQGVDPHEFNLRAHASEFMSLADGAPRRLGERWMLVEYWEEF